MSNATCVIVINNPILPYPAYMYISIPPMMMSPDEEGNNVDKNKEEKNARQTSVVVHVEQILRSLCIHFDWGEREGNLNKRSKANTCMFK